MGWYKEGDWAHLRNSEVAACFADLCNAINERYDLFEEDPIEFTLPDGSTKANPTLNDFEGFSLGMWIYTLIEELRTHTHNLARKGTKREQDWSTTRWKPEKDTATTYTNTMTMIGKGALDNWVTFTYTEGSFYRNRETLGPALQELQKCLDNMKWFQYTFSSNRADENIEWYQVRSKISEEEYPDNDPDQAWVDAYNQEPSEEPFEVTPATYGLVVWYNVYKWLSWSDLCFIGEKGYVDISDFYDDYGDQPDKGRFIKGVIYNVRLRWEWEHYVMSLSSGDFHWKDFILEDKPVVQIRVDDEEVFERLYEIPLNNNDSSYTQYNHVTNLAFIRDTTIGGFPTELNMEWVKVPNIHPMTTLEILGSKKSGTQLVVRFGHTQYFYVDVTPFLSYTTEDAQYE